MTLSNFFLVCFLVGFALSLISFLFGAMHLHLPHHIGGHISGHPGAGHGVFHAHVGHGPAVGHGVASAAAGKGPAVRGKGGASPIDFMTVCAFLAWFGGVGFLVTRYYALAAVAAVSAAMAGGLTGATIVFLFLAKVLLPHETQLDPADFEMVGTLGTVTVPIRTGGIGEIQFTQEGARRSASARSDDGQAMERGTEVVVERYERGMAYVRRFEELVK
jgi:membrane protein implicated in regulation of membrane protease activity